MKTKRTNREIGFTIVELIVVIMVVAVLAALVVPQIARRQRRDSRIGCTNNLKQVSLAFRLWAGDNADKMPMQVSVTNGGAMEWMEAGNVWKIFLVMSNELSTPKILFCPQDGNPNRIQATAFDLTAQPAYSGPVPFTNDNNVSYFVGVEADEVYPTRILAGDSNLEMNQKTVAHGFLNLWTNSPVRWDKTRHEKQCGNIALADGSVQNCTKAQLQKLLAETLIQTNRLLIP
ncbi:MAG: type II secretion system protein [Verrucomicrobia bacterium]|nr:type II secretion system protein [Verrucomicrobiota bacterium]